MNHETTTYLRDLGESIGVEFFYVGGCVRDGLLGNTNPEDIDLVARGLPAEDLVEALSRHGTARIVGHLFKVLMFYPDEYTGHNTFEIALPRTEKSLGVGHKDFEVLVDHTLPIEKDLLRRDFTVNSMARSLKTGELIDPLNGEADLRAGLLKAIHNQTFEEDPLRVIRGIRFIAKLGLTPDESTHEQMVANAHLLSTVSKERFQAELLKMLLQPHVGKALRYMRDIGALPHFIPELQDAVGCAQNKWHDHDVYSHLVSVVEHIVTDDPYEAIAALLHDIGKPPTRWVGPDGEAHFYMPEEGQEVVEAPKVPGAHEEVGAEMAYEILTRLKFSSWHAARVAGLVREHMFARGPNLSPRVARRFIARLDHMPGGVEENVRALFAIRYADNRGGKVKFSLEGDAWDQQFHRTVLAELEKQTAVSVRDLALNGHDMMQRGLVGVEIGEALNWLLEQVLDEPSLNTRSGLESLLDGRKEPAR